MISVKAGSGWDELAKAAEKAGRTLSKEVVKILNQTAADERRQINKDIRQELSVSAKSINAIMTLKKATRNRQVATIRLPKTRRLSLKEFRARQGRKGTSYKIGKATPRRTAPHAFMGPKPGVVAVRLQGHVYQRSNIHESGSEIRKLRGPSPWGVYVKNRMHRMTEARVEGYLRHRLERQIRENVLRAEGLIK